MVIIVLSTTVRAEKSTVMFHCESRNTSSDEDERWPPPGRRRRHPAGSSRYYVQPFPGFFPDPRICESDQAIHINSIKSPTEERGLFTVNSGLAFVSIPEDCKKPVFIVGHSGSACMKEGAQFASSIATSGFYSGSDSPPLSPYPDQYLDSKQNSYAPEANERFFLRSNSLGSDSTSCNGASSQRCRPTGGVTQITRLSAGDGL
ncbi:unnamed protein product [Schistocephalus solidus]|uniref:Expressed conserved protein n=1 Tax=Schistocephalus solidus TaxID=70667 RepID=A0A0X3P3G6_SCHSO|nr:unnamed protein product [Schistocephalus solidus]